MMWITESHVYQVVNGHNYSSVSDRINAYQRGIGSAFYTQNDNIESNYVSGLSLTHGVPGSRQHIWTFAAALSYDCANDTTNSRLQCPCTHSNVDWPYQLPSFIYRQ